MHSFILIKKTPPISESPNKSCGDYKLFIQLRCFFFLVILYLRKGHCK